MLGLNLCTMKKSNTRLQSQDQKASILAADVSIQGSRQSPVRNLPGCCTGPSLHLTAVAQRGVAGGVAQQGALRSPDCINDNRIGLDLMQESVPLATSPGKARTAFEIAAAMAPSASKWAVVADFQHSGIVPTARACVADGIIWQRPNRLRYRRSHQALRHQVRGFHRDSVCI